MLSKDQEKKVTVEIYKNKLNTRFFIYKKKLKIINYNNKSYCQFATHTHTQLYKLSYIMHMVLYKPSNAIIQFDWQLEIYILHIELTFQFTIILRSRPNLLKAHLSILTYMGERTYHSPNVCNSAHLLSLTRVRFLIHAILRGQLPACGPYNY